MGRGKIGVEESQKTLEGVKQCQSEKRAKIRRAQDEYGENIPWATCCWIGCAIAVASNSRPIKQERRHRYYEEKPAWQGLLCIELMTLRLQCRKFSSLNHV